MVSSTRLRQWGYFWEDQHPFARNNMAVLGLVAIVWVMLAMVTYLAPRLLSLPTVLELVKLQRIWLVTCLVLIAILIFNALRIVDHWRRKQVTHASVGLAFMTVPLVILLTLYMPSFTHATMSYRLGESYGDIYHNFQTLCDEWEATYGQQSAIAVTPSTEDLRLFQDRPEVKVWRDRKVVFFDFGDEMHHFGLACALGGDVPHTDGLADNYEYDHIDNRYYEFIEVKEQE